MADPALALPLVSVIIPCFNYGHFLTLALESIERQAYPRLETIVVDDGSSDSTAQVAMTHRVTLLRQNNHGLSAARNAGLAVARGEFVLFLDADDELLPGSIAAGVEALAADHHAAGVVRPCQVIDSQGTVLPAKYPFIAAGDDLYRHWLRQNFVWTPGAAMFRRAAVAEAGGFPTEVGASADYALYLQFARSHRIAYQDRQAVRYRQHDRNMSRDPVLMLKSTLAVYERERPDVARPYKDAFRAGVAAARAFYGEQIVERMRRGIRNRTDAAWRRAAVLTLLRHSPRIAFEHSARKLSRMTRGLPPAPVEPGRFHRD